MTARAAPQLATTQRPVTAESRTSRALRCDLRLSDTGLQIADPRIYVCQVPKLQQPIIEVAWRHVGEEGKIHYRARRPDGSDRHLIARQGGALYELLEQHLAAIGYTGPKSAGDQSWGSLPVATLLESERLHLT